eukprot:CAMPEP_0115558172 /NCGR_PEP_ID=MMETSP0271-20121206/99300_1 /TAXON_ID=71861 /ORGANISM="Scrippsiella trochoidea, Strain CCMP3099" /LENGTH=36 /DNA_ID= /DNA_START= /DNA_END= /DNA_ORIENTATION=
MSSMVDDKAGAAMVGVGAAMYRQHQRTHTAAEDALV